MDHGALVGSEGGRQADSAERLLAEESDKDLAHERVEEGESLVGIDITICD